MGLVMGLVMVLVMSRARNCILGMLSQIDGNVWVKFGQNHMFWLSKGF